jgi:hypothetical protein
LYYNGLFVSRLRADTTAAIFWLKNRDRIRWGDRQQIEHGARNYRKHLATEAT